MPDYVSLTCPSCGGRLQIAKHIERFACEYCGNEHVVIREGGIVALAPVAESVKKIEISTDRTASELAILRLEKEIQELAAAKGELAQRQAWLHNRAIFDLPYRVFGGVFIGLMALSLVIRRQISRLELFFLLAGCLLLIIGTIVNEGKGKTELERRNEAQALQNEIDEIDQRIAAKTAELKQCKEIVSRV